MAEPVPELERPGMRELADGLAQYLQSYMQEVVAHEQHPLSVDYQSLADDFVESCVVDVMQIGGGPLDVALARHCWCAACEAKVLEHEHPNDPIARLSGRHFVTCNLCGSKRCPRAGHHDRACAGPS